jgi:parallel beta-helix repeat protein
MTLGKLPQWRSTYLHFAALLTMIAAILVLPGTARADSVACGAVLTNNVTVDNDVLNCLGDGLVVAADGITIDLNGHTLDGTGKGVGIRSDGHDGVTIKNGTVNEFEQGVQLNAGSVGNVVDGLTVSHNKLVGVQLDGATQSQVRSTKIEFQSNQGLALLNGSNGNLLFNNTLFTNGDTGIFVQNSNSNLFQSNHVTISGDRGVVLEGASTNWVVKNTIENNSDGGLNLLLGSNSNFLYGNTLTLNQDAGFIVDESNGNRVELNTVTQNGDAGVVVTRSTGSVLVGNTFSGSSDAGIFLQYANDSTIHGNDVRFNTGGIELTSSNGNRVQLNDASSSTGIGIEMQDSINNTVLLNTANANGAQGIHVEGATENHLQGNVIWCNTANENKGDGIVLTALTHTVKSNLANANEGWGIHAAIGSVDGGGNVAAGNSEPAQVSGVVSNAAPRDCPAPPPPPPPLWPGDAHPAAPASAPATAPPPATTPAASALVGTGLARKATAGARKASAVRKANARKAPSRCRIPKLKGRKFFKARKAIVRAGCRVGKVSWRKSKIRRGIVVRQSPRAGTRVKHGFRVKLVRSKGAPVDKD